MDTDSPVPVIGLSSGWVYVSTTQDHSCAINASGGVVCWGNDGEGELGDGNVTNTAVTHPVNVVGLSSGVSWVGTNQAQTCALTTAGAVLCWGSNYYGQLGSGDAGSSAVPVPVTGLGSGVKAVAVVESFACALTTGGAVKCWGNQFGSTPTVVSGLSSGVAIISGGNNCACAATTSGAASCWGGNTYGQLGDGTTNDSLTTPVPVVGMGAGVTMLAGGEGFETCAVQNGVVKCWGDNAAGELGYGMPSGNSPTPVTVTNIGNVTSLSVGGYHACAWTTAGVAKCWGSNSNGQLGLGNTTTTSSDVPVTVQGI